MSEPFSLLEVRDISKQFPGVLALDAVNLSLKKGEVLAVLGENGAGKSTLMKILAGVQNADSGKIIIKGKEAQINSTQDAIQCGIALIHQELNLANNLEVGANLFLGREPRHWGIFIDKRQITKSASHYLDQVGLKIDPETELGNLSIGRQQMVEIAKSLSVNAQVLIMDEPTSSLTQRETSQLFKVIKDLSKKGVSLVYISHRLGEVQEIADRVIVLRDGKNAGELMQDQIDHDNMVKLMVGREVSQFYHHTPHLPGDPILELHDWISPAHPNERLNFSIRKGEIVGIAGLVGAGRTELLQSLFGIIPALSGEIYIDSQREKIQTPSQAIDAGIALVPEDRKAQGLILEMSVKQNMSLASLERDQKKGFLNHLKERAITKKMIRELGVKTPDEDQLVQLLSGGNQQKIVLGKWLVQDPKILLLDEPTRGIDVGAKSEIYGLMEGLAKKGVAIVFVSSEMEEILGMSDRVIVMHEGRFTGELHRSQLSEEAIMKLATGGTFLEKDLTE